MFKHRQRRERITEKQTQAIIELLILRDGNPSAVAALTGVSQPQVRAIKYENLAVYEEKRAVFKKIHVLESQEIIMEWTQMARDKAHDASFRDLTVGIGILSDKAAMHAGDNGSTVTHVHKADPEAMRRLDAALAQCKPLGPPGEVIEADFTIKE